MNRFLICLWTYCSYHLAVFVNTRPVYLFSRPSVPVLLSSCWPFIYNLPFSQQPIPLFIFPSRVFVSGDRCGWWDVYVRLYWINNPWQRGSRGKWWAFLWNFLFYTFHIPFLLAALTSSTAERYIVPTHCMSLRMTVCTWMYFLFVCLAAKSVLAAANKTEKKPSHLSVATQSWLVTESSPEFIQELVHVCATKQIIWTTVLLFSWILKSKTELKWLRAK